MDDREYMSHHGQSRLGKLRLLLWKNLLLRKRHWFLSILELGIPIALMCLVVFLRVIPDSIFLPVYFDRVSTFSVASELDLKFILCGRSSGVWITDKCYYYDNGLLPGDRKLFWGPPNNFTKGVIDRVKQEIFFKDSYLQNVSSKEELDNSVNKAYFESTQSFATFYIGIFFNLNNSESDDVPIHLNYDLRLQKMWFTEYIYPFLQIPGPRNHTGYLTGKGASYAMDGFAILQNIIDRAYMKVVSGNEEIVNNFTLETGMYPYPPYVQDHGLSQLFGSLLPTFIVFSLLMLSPTLIKSIVYEKETGVRELIRTMGLEGWLIWFGWFMYSFTTIFLVCIIITVMLKIEITTSLGTVIPAILVYSEPTLIWFILVLYGISSICFCFAISCFFSKPTLATTIGVLVWLLSYFIPRALMDRKYINLGLTPKIFSCLLPNTAMTLAFRVIGMFEGRALGIQWSSLWDTGNPRDQLTMGMIIIMFTVDIFFYIAITWYVDQVMPGIYGVPRPWYFIFHKSFYTQSHSVKNDEENLLEDLGSPSQFVDNLEFIEAEPEGLKIGIKIRGLRKEFKSGKKVKVAVEHVDLTCFEGQCTVLLGHNGAGKTTTMSVLTGVYSPSGGYAEINGFNIKTNLKEARAQVGLCPQHNTLFTDLTVEEHLLFFARLKGLNRKEAKKESVALLRRLQLDEKKNQFGGQLSGGMKRKLCLAIALIGGSQVIILDEPSSGLDPESRRWMWEVVQQERGTRTVLVTTHHMEEADVLGDRVAIMANGCVVCSGSSLFLKNTFGDGYTLSLIGHEGIQHSKVNDIICGHLENASLRSSDSKTLIFKLPPQTDKFPNLLDQLTKEKQELGVDHLGLSLTTLEQVFLKVGEIVDTKQRNMLDERTFLEEHFITAFVNVNPSNEETSNDSTTSLPNSASSLSSQGPIITQGFGEHKLMGKNLLKERIRSLWIKKYIYTKRKWILILTQALIPVLVTILCLLVDRNFNEQTFMEPPIELNISMYKKSFSSVEFHDDLEQLKDNYMSLFQRDSFEVSETDNITSTLLQASYDDLNLYRENYITSALFQKDLTDKIVTRVLYQSVPYHTTGVGINLVDNAVLKTVLGHEGHTITTNNSPLPPRKNWHIDGNQSTFSSTLYSMVMPIALAFLTSSFLVFPLQERVSKAKQIQLMTGTPSSILWFTTYSWDFLSYLASAFLIFICFMIFDSKGYFTADGGPGALFLLLLLYGIGSIPMAYVFSFPFQSAASGFAVLALVNILAGMIISTATLALNLANSEKLSHISNIIGNITSFGPSFPASKGFMGIVDTSNYNRLCEIVDPSVRDDLCDNIAIFAHDSPYMPCCPKYCQEFGVGGCFEKIGYLTWSYPGQGMYLMYMFVDAVFYFLLLWLLEAKVFGIISSMWSKGMQKYWKLKSVKLEEDIIDEDVRKENEMAASLMRDASPQESAIVVQDLTKVFPKAEVFAVKGISFHVKKGECFGLLGVNGAGKTTIFNMLTGDEIPTSGDARIGKNFLSQGRKKFMEEIGYCPQFDAIIGELTGEEMLALMAGLRGVPRQAKPQLIQRLVTLVDLTECAKRPSDTYSGGNKRKLSTAMALVGQPPLVFLDEPTSGVDPASRRRVWEAVTDATRCGQSIILTSHSMDECEALCSSVVIMANSSFKCIGSPQHLKIKYGKGYTLQIKVKQSLPQEQEQEANIPKEECESNYNALLTALKETIQNYFNGAKLTDEHRGMLAYRVSSTITWASLFAVMEALKTGSDLPDNFAPVNESRKKAFKYLIEDYAATDPSLEQVFLSFARNSDQRGAIYECEDHSTKL